MVEQFGDSAYGTSLFGVVALSLIGTIPFMIKAGSEYDKANKKIVME